MAQLGVRAQHTANPPPPSLWPPPTHSQSATSCLRSQAKIVAMTCTHAALKRREFLQLAFQYDNLLMEEAAQILEVETFIPMMLQVGGGGDAGGALPLTPWGDIHPTAAGGVWCGERGVVRGLLTSLLVLLSNLAVLF